MGVGRRGQEWWVPPEVVAEAGFSVQGLVFDRMKTTSPLLRKWVGGGGSVEPLLSKFFRG